MEAGLDVARINFSHGTHEQHARTIAAVRQVADSIGRTVAILGDDTGGPDAIDAYHHAWLTLMALSWSGALVALALRR